jgi:hypothetical protein
MERNDKLRLKWLRNSIIGLLLNGFGLSILGEAIIAKMKDAPTLEWVWKGTLALVLINAGISFVGDAIKYKVYLDSAEKKTRNRKKRTQNFENQ